jgi:hypothetical protein
VKTSSSSPESQAASGLKSVACVGCATIAAAGAMAIAIANPPARIRRRVVIGVIVRILRTLRALCRHSRCSLGISLRRIRKSWDTSLRPSFVSAIDYGLELTDDRGSGCGPWACSSSDRPMHSPELAPVHGMLSTSGSPPGEVWPNSGEFGTRSGTHTPVKVSSDSPPAHAAIVGAEVDMATTATAGAAAIATANPPARSSRRGGSFKIAIVTLSVMLLYVRRPKLWRQSGSASRRHYSGDLENAVPLSIKMVRQSHF